MLLAIQAWDNKKKQFFFTHKEIKNYVKSQSTSMEKYIVDKQYQLDKKHLEKINIILTGNQKQDSQSICDTILPVIEENVLRKLQIEPPRNVLMRCSKIRKDAYFHMEGFYEFIKVILKKQSVTEHLKPTEHYVVCLQQAKTSLKDVTSADQIKSFQIPAKYDNSLLYCLYSSILDKLLKVNDTNSYDKLFINRGKIAYFKANGLRQYHVLVKGNCFNSQKVVLEIDKILFIMEYIDNEINVYLESLPISARTKEYLFALSKFEYYFICLCFLLLYTSKNASKTKYKSLSDIKYKS